MDWNSEKIGRDDTGGSVGQDHAAVRFSRTWHDWPYVDLLAVDHRRHLSNGLRDQISYDAIDKAERRGDAAQLILTNGSSVPVSRGHMPKLRAKGIL